MEANIDNFINYSDSPSLFLSENFPDLNFDFRSPETEISTNNNPPATTPSYSSAPSNHFSNNHSQRGPASHTGSGHRSPDTMTSSPDDESRFGQTTASVSTNSKKIQKRNREEKKTKAKQELEMLLATTAKKYIPEGIDDPNLDDKTKRKMVQMVKNRVAAQKTRDKRKNYMSELEEVKSHLDEANRQLNERNRLLEQRVRELENAQAQLMAENQELKRGSQFNASQSRCMPPIQQVQYPPMQQQHVNSPHYPSLPSTPQNLMQPRFQSVNSMSSFDGFSFPQSQTRLNPAYNNNYNNNNSHTTITIENNDSQNSSGGSNGSNHQHQQFSSPFPVLSRGNSGKRNFYGYLLAITMVLACFTTLHIETGKVVVQRNHTDPDPTKTEPSTVSTTDDPNSGTGTDTEGHTDWTPDDGTEEGTDEGTETETSPETFADPEDGTDADPHVTTDSTSTPSNGTGTNEHDGSRGKVPGSDDSSSSDSTMNTFFTTNEGTDDGTDSSSGPRSFGPSRFKNLDTNNTNNTNTTTITIDGGSSGSSGYPNVGRILVLTEILDEIDSMERDY